MEKQDNSTDANGANGANEANGTGELAPDRQPEPIEAAARKARRPRGFAAMDRKLVSEIARKGGKAAHSAGTAHEFTSEEARNAGRKGGQAAHANRRKPVAAGETPGGEQKTEG